MKNPVSPTRAANVRRLVSLLAVGALTALAQQAPEPAQPAETTPATPPAPVTPPAAPSAPPTAQPAEEDIIVLSPFTVVAEEDTGYVADRALSGGRLATDLSDITTNVSVATKDFLSDIGANDLESLVDFSLNVQTDAGNFNGSNINTNQFDGSRSSNSQFSARIRGLRSSRTVDYIPIDWDQDNYNIGRIETSLGSNALLFGNGGAGGNLNQTRERANLNRRVAILELMANSENGFRWVYDLNQPLIKRKLAFRFIGMNTEQETWRSNTETSRWANYFTLAWQPFRNTSVTLQLEKGNNHKPYTSLYPVSNTVNPESATTLANTANRINPAAIGLPVIPSGTTFIVPPSDRNQWRYADFLIRHYDPARPEYFTYDYLKHNLYGPYSYRDQDYQDIRLIIEQRISSDLFLNAYFGKSKVLDSSLYAIRDNVSMNQDPVSGQAYLQGLWVKDYGMTERETYGAVLAWNPKFWGTEHRISASAEESERANLNRTGNNNAFRLNTYAFNPDGTPLLVASNLTARYDFDRNGDPANIYLGNPYAPVGTYGPNTPVVGEFTDSTTGARRINLFSPGILSPDGSAYFTGDDNLRDRTTLAANIQSYWFKKRFITNFGYRNDRDRLRDRDAVFHAPTETWRSVGNKIDNLRSPALPFDPVTNPIEPAPFTTQKSIGFGAIYRLTSSLSIGAGHAENVEGQANTRILPDGRPAPSSRGSSDDISLSYRMLNDRINMKVTAFQSGIEDDYQITSNILWSQIVGRNAGGSNAEQQRYRPSWATFNGDRVHILRPYTQIINALEANGVDAATIQTYRNALGDIPGTFVNSVSRPDKSKGLEFRVSANLGNWTSIFNYSYTKADNLEAGKEVEEFFNQIATHVAQLPDTLPVATYSTSWANGGSTAGRPAGYPLTVTAPGTTARDGYQAIIDDTLALAEEALSERRSSYGNIKHNANWVVKYAWKEGRFKGLSANVRAVYRGKEFIGNVRQLNADASGVTITKVYKDDDVNFGMGMQYRFKTDLFRKTNITMGLDVTNVFRSEPEFKNQRPALGSGTNANAGTHFRDGTFAIYPTSIPDLNRADGSAYIPADYIQLDGIIIPTRTYESLAPRIWRVNVKFDF